MAIVFKDAKVFFGGYEMTSQHNQVAMDYAAEALDETAFGDSTRKMRGGLKTARLTGGGYFKAATGNVDPVYFDSIDLTDAVVMVAPDTIAEGATSTGTIFGFKSVLLSYSPFNQRVGEIQAFSINAEGRGV